MKKISCIFMLGGALLASAAGAQSLISAESLRASASLADTVFISNAGREGVFFYDAADKVSADNTGTVIVVASNGRRYKRSFSGAVNAKWFGLKEGTSVDNAPAVNSAIAALKSNQELLIEAGNYYFQNPVVLPATKTVKFTAMGTLHFGNRDGLIVEKTHNVYLENIVGAATVGGGLDDYSTFVGSGLTLNNAYHSNITVQFASGFKNAIVMKGSMTANLGNGSQYNKVQFGMLTRNKVGILITTDDVGTNWVNENTFTGGRIAGETGLLIEKGDQQTDPFNGNKFYNIGFEALVNGIDASFFKFNYIIAPRFESVANGINFRSVADDNTIVSTGLSEAAFVPGGIGKRTVVMGKLLTSPSSVTSGEINFADNNGKFISVNMAPSATVKAESQSTVISLSKIVLQP